MNDTSISMPAVTDSFSWKRVLMIARYVYPGLKKQTIAFPIFSLVLGLSMVFAPFDFTTVFSLCISVAYMVAPIGLCNRDFQSTMGMLPVKGSEKLVFLLAYFWICVPLLLYVPSISIFLVTTFVDPEKVKAVLNIYNMTFGIMTPANMALSQFLGMSFQTFVLYIVVKATTNRTFKGLAAGIGIYVAFVFLAGVAGGIYFGAYAIKKFESDPQLAEMIHEQFQDLEQYDNMDPESLYGNNQLVDAVMDVMGVDTWLGSFINDFVLCMSLLGLVWLVIEVALIYKRLNRGGF